MPGLCYTVINMPKFTDRQKYRILEMIPGAMTWTTLVAALAFSFFKPLWVVYFIIVFSLYWFFNVVYMLIWVLISWRRYRRDSRVNWHKRLREISGWKDLRHLIVLPTLKEPIEILRACFQSLCESKYPLNKFIVVLAGEERDLDNFLKNAEIIEREFGDKFLKLLVTVHPDNIVGELKGKGANIHWAGKKAKELIDRMEISYKDIVVSCFDIDTRSHPQYFAYLAYKYLAHPNPTRASYQPITVYNNNIWSSPAITRIIYNGTTFWNLSELSRPDRLLTFSSHSMSFRALVDVGFWPPDVVTEDSQICLRCLMHYDGDYEIVPMYVPVSMDTPYVGRFWRTLSNQYKQLRRWGYGAENFPYMAWNFVRNKKMPRIKTVRYIWNYLQGIYLWAVAPVLILVLGRLPLVMAGEDDKAQAIVQNAPFILERLMTVAMVGIFFSVVLGLFLLPPRPEKFKRSRFIFMVLQWLLFPIGAIAFGSIPALDAQTRLMFGKYMGFQVTEKGEKK